MVFLSKLRALQRMRLLVLCGFLFLLIGCATRAKNQDVEVRVPNEVWWASVVQSSPKDIRNLAEVRARFKKVYPGNFTLGFAKTDEINAYASIQKDATYVIFTDAFVREFGSDSDALAVVLGHELAHHYLGHTQPGYRDNRDFAVEASSHTFGLIASYFIPFGGLIVGNAVRAVGRGYDRDEERAADLKGMEWAMAAGYSPCGSYRFSNRLQHLSSKNSLAILSTHPGDEERKENAIKFAQANGLQDCR